MGNAVSKICCEELCDLVGTLSCPPIFDVRREAAFVEATDLVPTAKWRDHRFAAGWAKDVPTRCEVVVYCVHGHQVSQATAAILRSLGIPGRYLEGGIEAYRESGGLVIGKAARANATEDRPSRWVTRERPKIDRIACPWFVRRFVDRDAVIHFVSPDRVKEAAVELDATPFDVPDTAFSHDGESCSFDAFLAGFRIADPALVRLAEIVRGAVTARLDLAPEAAGLLAMSLGLAAIESDDHAMLEKALPFYDALYGWCRIAAGESRGCPPVQAGASHAMAAAR